MQRVQLILATRGHEGFRVWGLPIGSYPTPFLRYLLFYIGDPNHKTRYPQKGVGYVPLGRVQDLELRLLTIRSGSRCWASAPLMMSLGMVPEHGRFFPGSAAVLAT